MNTLQARTSTGFLHWVFPAILLLGALDVLLSGRDLTMLFLQLESTAEAQRPAVMVWVQRGVSLMLLLASIEQIANHVALHWRTPSVALLSAFILYWLGTVGVPALFAANPLISHELIYSLAIGVACCLVGERERERIVHRARDALFVVMLAGIALIPIKTHMVLDTAYSQGLIPGLPRFGGLTAHPVTQGMLAQIALLVLWRNPYGRPWVNRAAWLLGLGVLFMAQSKTAWMAFVVCGLAIAFVRHGGNVARRAGDPRRGELGVFLCLIFIVGVLGLGSWLLLTDAFGRISDFFNSPEGAQFVTLTGRDRIWAAALEEWRLNPTFGYGLSIWDAAYRTAIDIPNATHAHNQFLDNLARSGTVGAAVLVVYAAVLMVMSLRYARATGGLSLALFISIALRSVSEVPLLLQGYGSELVTHLLLLVTLAAAASTQPRTQAARSPLRYGVAS